MPILYSGWITREDVQKQPDYLFVFGDNMVGEGYGGQAEQMRGEPNAVGIPTKWFPNMMPGSFFNDDDFEDWIKAAKPSFNRLLLHQAPPIVWPKRGIGTGRAQLRLRAPLIWGFIAGIRFVLEGR